MLKKLITCVIILSSIAYVSISYVLLFYHKINIPQFQDQNTIKGKQLVNLILELRPILKDLVKTKNFKYFRVDVDQPCKMNEQQFCTSKTKCELKCECKNEDLPKNWIEEDLRLKDQEISRPQIFDYLKPEILNNIEGLQQGWGFDKVTNNSLYVDLTQDREEYTGYQGQHIWKYLYNNHCQQSYEQCNDNKFLYKMISGMHTSVSSHLSFYYYDDKNQVFPNVFLYFQKVGKYQERMENLVFANSILIRSFNRFYPYIQHFPADSGDFYDDMSAKNLLDQLSEKIEQIKDINFDDSQIFGSLLSQEEKKEQFVKYFREILQILDCVDCKKCKVYGKMQVIGIGASLRILMQKSGDLQRNEFIALINTINKWTQSVQIMYSMQRQIQEEMLNQFCYLTGLFLVILIILRYTYIVIDINTRKKVKTDQSILFKNFEKKNKQEIQIFFFVRIKINKLFFRYFL